MSSPDNGPLSGKRILIVDDEPLLALDVADMVEQRGGEVVGPALSLWEATRLAEETPVDAGLLDIDLAGARVWPLARNLMQSGTPIAFISAKCGMGDIPDEFSGSACLAKPATERRIVNTLFALIQSGPGPQTA